MIKDRLLSIVLMFFCMFASSVYADHAEKALQYAEKKIWNKAISEANKHKDPVLRKIIYSKQYADTSYKNEFRQVASFIENNPDWPNIEALNEAVESYIDDQTNKKAIIKHFSTNYPITEVGFKYYAIALTEIMSGEKRPKAPIRNGWVYGDFSENEEKKFLEDNSNVLTNTDHVKKMDFMLWKNDREGAKKILNLLGPKEQKVYDAHIAFIDNKRNKNSLYRRVPSEYKHLSRLLYRHLSQYKKHDKIPLAAGNQILKAPYDPMFHKDWWRMKNLFARNMMQRKKYSLAYKIASSRRSDNNFSKAQSEWLAGWVALKYLKIPNKAYDHFDKLYKTVKMPITRARASYWLGIAAKELGELDLAKMRFREAAELNFTFYGQMAMIELGETKFTLPPSPKMTKEGKAFYKKNEFARATNLLIKHKKIRDARLYGKAAVYRAKNHSEAALIVSSIRESNNLFYIIELAKAAAQKGYLLIADNHPTPYKLPNHDNVEHALTYAIIMKESAFDHKAVSHANAHGLMQIIPKTGCEMQKKINHRCSVRKLTSDPHHNIRLGNNYLADLIKQYGGSYILMASEYNAGPDAVKSWIKRNGDPRKMKDIHQIIEWMETISYHETRDYVQRILEYLQVYREILYQESRLTLKEDLFRGSIYGKKYAN